MTKYETIETVLRDIVESGISTGRVNAAASAALAMEPDEAIATKLETNQFDCFHVSGDDAARLRALPVGTHIYTAPQSAPCVPDGWVFFTADFSMQASSRSKTGVVMLTRDQVGRAAWHQLTEEEQEVVELYVSGVGCTISEAIADAAKQAMLVGSEVVSQERELTIADTKE